jgi:hypothetical protein
MESKMTKKTTAVRSSIKISMISMKMNPTTRITNAEIEDVQILPIAIICLAKMVKVEVVPLSVLAVEEMMTRCSKTKIHSRRRILSHPISI